MQEVLLMPITHANFTVGTPGDVHVLRGQSTQPLSKFLGVWPKVGLPCTLFDYVHVRHQTDVRVEFRPVFRSDDNPDEFVGFGIHVNRSDGTVRVDPGPPPQHQPSNFLVEATVTLNGGVPAPGEFPVSRLRIHVHGSVAQVWLTPPGLGIRRPVATGACQTNYGFTVRAQFDDGTVGDVTTSHEVSFSPATHFYVKPDEVESRIQLSDSDGVGSIFPVTVTTSPAWGGISDVAHPVEILEPWATEPNVPMAEWIDGHVDVMNGSLKPENVPNVLFLACGFADPDVFTTMIKNTHQNLTTHWSLRPFDFLRTSMAYWHLPIKAATDGVAIQCEVAPFDRDLNGEKQTFAAPLPMAEEPPPTGEWSVQHLLYFAGLPVPDDLNRTMAELNDRWDAVMPDIPERVFPLAVVDEWLALAKRTFIDEVDNFPAVSIGTAPQAETRETAILGFHDRRADDDERAAFLSRVTAKPIGGMAPITLGVPAPGDGIGNIWAKDHPDFPFDNTPFTVAYTNCPFGRAIRATDGVHTRLSLRPRTLDDEYPGFPVTPVDDGRNALRLDLPQPSIAMLLDGTWHALGHELAHTFGLGDEYVEDATDYPLDERSVDEANQTTSKAVLNTDGSVRLNDIKWNWHRARKAVVTTGKIVKLGDTRFQVPVALGHGVALAVGEPVLLRQRVKRKVIGRAPLTSAEFTVESLGPDGDKVVITTTKSGLSLDAFTAGSVLYTPFVAPPDVVPARPYLTLVSPAAERIMRDQIKGAMNGTVCNAANNLSAHGSTEVPLKEDPNNKVKALDKPFLVGVYHGARQHACGILRPAGQCMMRGSFDIIARFCPVCQFALVEQIDPEKHGLLDSEYQKVYPL
jgi:hypothetical protein